MHPTRTLLHNKDDALGQELHNEECFVTVALLSGKLWPFLPERCTITFLFLPLPMTSARPRCPDDPTINSGLYFRPLGKSVQICKHSNQPLLLTNIPPLHHDEARFRQHHSRYRGTPQARLGHQDPRQKTRSQHLPDPKSAQNPPCRPLKSKGWPPKGAIGAGQACLRTFGHPWRRRDGCRSRQTIREECWQRNQ